MKDLFETKTTKRVVAENAIMEVIITDSCMGIYKKAKDACGYFGYEVNNEIEDIDSSVLEFFLDEIVQNMIRTRVRRYLKYSYRDQIITSYKASRSHIWFKEINLYTDDTKYGRLMLDLSDWDIIERLAERIEPAIDWDICPTTAVRNHMLIDSDDKAALDTLTRYENSGVAKMIMENIMPTIFVETEYCGDDDEEDW